MPKSKYVDPLGQNAVVEEVVNAAEMQTANALKSVVRRDGPDPRLGPKKGEGRAQFVVDRTWCQGSVLLPPFGRLLDLTSGTASDLNG